MKFIIIGLSDSLEPELSPKLIETISKREIFSGGKRHYTIVKDLLPENHIWIDITVPLDSVFKEYRACFQANSEADSNSNSNSDLKPEFDSELDSQNQFTFNANSNFSSSSNSEIVVFASGDPLFFGFANTIKREMPEAEIELYPYFNSLQLLAHRTLTPYHDMIYVSQTGRPWSLFDEALIRGYSKMGVLTDRKKTPATIATRMIEYGYTNYKMIVGEAMGGENERVSTLSLEEVAKSSFAVLNCLILIKIHTRDIPVGIPDSSFAILEGRPKMMTKMPIRLLSLSMLDLGSKSVLWDVGFCTGSISIEAQRQYPHLKLCSFEKREESRKLIEDNMRRFGCPNIEYEIGDIFDTDLSKYPKPDAIFIGGHGGRLEELLQILNSYILEGGVIVFNAVSESSQEAFKRGVALTGLKITSTQTVQLDNHNPITIFQAK